MEAANNGTANAAWVRYEQYLWGDWIEGTKEQLQALGLGVGLAFPGEVGCALRSELKVRDPRGYDARIFRSRVDRVENDLYYASLRFPHWPKNPNDPQWAPAFTGVKKREHLWFDEYSGSAEHLAAAGLARVDQLPGMPGMRKTCVTILADGKVADGNRNTASNPDCFEPGARWIERSSKSSYRVHIVLSKQEEKRRQAIWDNAEIEWKMQVRALARPPRLQPMPQAKIMRFESACVSAARDVRFQGMLARVVASCPGKK